MKLNFSKKQKLILGATAIVIIAAVAFGVWWAGGGGRKLEQAKRRSFDYKIQKSADEFYDSFFGETAQEISLEGRRQNFQKAVSELEKTVESQPDNVNALLKLAISYHYNYKSVSYTHLTLPTIYSV